MSKTFYFRTDLFEWCVGQRSVIFFSLRNINDWNQFHVQKLLVSAKLLNHQWKPGITRQFIWNSTGFLSSVHLIPHQMLSRVPKIISLILGELWMFIVEESHILVKQLFSAFRFSVVPLLISVCRKCILQFKQDHELIAV